MRKAIQKKAHFDIMDLDTVQVCLDFVSWGWTSLVVFHVNYFLSICKDAIMPFFIQLQRIAIYAGTYGIHIESYRALILHISAFEWQVRDKSVLLCTILCQVAKKSFIPALFGHATEDVFIQPHHSDLIFKAYTVRNLSWVAWCDEVWQLQTMPIN